MSNNYAIVSDVACDLNAELRERFGVDGYIKGHITTPDGKEIATTLEWDFTNPKDFYSSLKSHHNIYKTASASTEEIIAFLEDFLSQGKDVIVISLSGRLSVTYNLILNAQKKLQDKYPERKVIAIDSRKYSVALGMLTIQACLLREQGLSIDENAAELERIKMTIHQMGTMDDLFFVASKGRISNSKAFLGTLVGIKPMGDYDRDGMVTVLAKVKGYEKAYKVTVEYIKRTIIQPENQIIIVAQTSREKQAEVLAGLINENVKPREVILSDVYPANGVNIGPGLLAAYYLGTTISDLKYETETMKSILEGN